ncbi:MULTISPECIES: TAXI family TRAP transporter solute-binding subunit [Halomonas]|uniref:TAXI family TRAP transporter solute-binding subunit n=3 Tax=Halomonas TaxID=2745 RepID=A0AAU7KGX8_9GAMM|nr:MULTISPECIES: TAXI family TRAP transporter solute-binding subunit [Halomonas]MBR9770264.1 TAXI family TRAP transporter solute-binding subunit [Gammaproteobacteria bacterium]KJZ08084.1 C4-dicarboxylate ABC transporter substrate-binding protein [Halomonas sp. S2151]MAR72116.1 C4-dicarboxylate ABC transporter substrate-binding protein [Halomonas sp.]MBR9879548.1 TAXI family TRAP transporter solute-binding subunit [Gammaproteobacteria bacterium]MBY6110085.1 TAXI family TRAP transporter solute-b|tara:strand:+ start:186 stop:1169 length:984 start_codon:yes stop_codon:yes gene_type:complete
MKRHAFSAAALSSAILGAAMFTSPAMAQDEEQFITIGTGGQTGVYYVVGQSVCRFVNRNSEETGIRCNAPSTGGSVANVNGIRSGELTMGVAQSDVQYQAYNGTGNFEGEAYEDLRAVFKVHGEPLTILARADADIESLDDLAGKRVNIGNPGSGQRNTMEVVMDAKGWTEDTFSLASQLDAAEMASALSDNNIDAMAYVVGHPNGSIQEATTTVDAKLVPLNDDAIKGLVEEYPYYSMSTIPGGLYKGNPDDVETFGVAATFVTSAEADDELVYQTVKAVFDNFDRFKRLHPAFENLDPQDMVSNGLSAPLHEGAARYYREQGWIE